ncbi:hypothetical protein FOA22_25590 [Heyndrickxia oleronia]|uniref:hypothetical protein n=1 Tax=Heyndrickxia oleronia TaxID=38875 RepID=UPI0003A26802|nr:hypothetical protein [Heyndrickxia oleronia]
MNKLKSFVIVLLLCLVGFTSGLNNSVQAAEVCTTVDEKCKSVRMYYGEAQYVASGQTYFNKGETIYYGWDNDPPGIMQVAFQIYNSAGAPVSRELVAVREGNNYGFWTVTSSGYYYLFAACEGGNDRRCSGGGKFMKW